MSYNHKLSYADIIRRKMKTADNMMGHPITIRQAQQLMTKPDGGHYSYEHIRKVIVGEAVQSRDMNDAFCEMLGLDHDEMWAMAQGEKLHKKYGSSVISLLPPSDKRLKAVWQRLTAEDRSRVVQLAETLAGTNDLAHDTVRMASGL